MKNTELYRTIQSLVEVRREQTNMQKVSFAHDYCKQQIQKKKLIPFNPKSKMNKIMQNFHQLDTYVNVEQLFDYVNVLVDQRKRESEKSQTTIKWKSKQTIPVDNQATIINKFRSKLGPFNRIRNLKEVQNISSLSFNIENQSNLQKLKKQNHSPEGKYDFIEKILKNKPDLITHDKQWNNYENINSSLSETQKPCKSLRLTQTQYRDKLKKKQQRAELIHQVSTYLQIILENRHKKKWEKSTNNKIRQQKQTLTPIKCNSNLLSGKNISKLDDDEIFSEKKLINNISGLHAATVPSSPRKNKKQTKKRNPKKKDQIPSTRVACQTQSYISNKKLKQNFTFRNRNIKQCLMKKIGNFIDYVESEEKLFKKDKSTVNAEINRLQSKYQHSEKVISHPEDKQINDIQEIVRLQK